MFETAPNNPVTSKPIVKTEPADAENVYKRLISHLARKFFMQCPRFDIDDLYSEGLVACIKSIKERPLDTPYSESTWVYNAISFHLMSFIRRNKFDLHVSEDTQKKAYAEGTTSELYNSAIAIKSWRNPLSVEENGLNDCDDIAASGEPPPIESVIKSETFFILNEELDHLPSRERTILKEFFIEGLTLKDIGQRQGTTPQRVGQIKDRAFSKLQANMKRRYSEAVV
jgi:RNA polymerase sigma factor (sigma-70 family)